MDVTYSGSGRFSRASDVPAPLYLLLRFLHRFFFVFFLFFIIWAFVLFSSFLFFYFFFYFILYLDAERTPTRRSRNPVTRRSLSGRTNASSARASDPRCRALCVLSAALTLGKPVARSYVCCLKTRRDTDTPGPGVHFFLRPLESRMSEYRGIT